jgi:hypothetical protein
MSKLNVKPAHDALFQLLQDIEKAGKENLPNRPTSSIKDGRAWVSSLEATRKVLHEWCDGFFVEVKSKQ